MNAYELDKWVENSHYYETDEVIKLLRQLTKEKAELEKQLNNQRRISNHEHIVAENALKQVTELEKQVDELIECKWSYENLDGGKN